MNSLVGWRSIFCLVILFTFSRALGYGQSFIGQEPDTEDQKQKQNLPALGSQDKNDGKGQPSPESVEAEQQGIDSLFNDPSPSPAPNAAKTDDAAAAKSDKTTSPAATLPSDLAKSIGIKFFGTTTAQLAGALGWTDWPDPQTLGTNFKPFGGFTANTSLGFEARPASDFRIRGSANIGYPNPILTIGELFADYSLQETVFLRVGVYGYGWGYARVFNLADITSRVRADRTEGTTTFNLKANIPFSFGSVTLLMRGRDDYFTLSPATAPTPQEAGYGSLFEFVTGPIEWSAGAYYQKSLAKRAMLGFKTSVAGLDVFAEGTAAYYDYGNNDIEVYPTFDCGIYYEPSDRIKIYGEYAYDGERPDNVDPVAILNDPTLTTHAAVIDAPVLRGHNSLLGIKFSKIGDSSLRISCAWQQNYAGNYLDWSGFILPLVEFDPAPYLTAQFAFPVIFGSPTSYYMTNSPVTGGLRLGVYLALNFRIDYSD
jgi:hypothetical protein